MTGSEALRVVVIGGGGHGREAADIVAALAPSFRLIGLLDDTEPLGESGERLRRRGIPYLGPTDWLAANEAAFVLGIGDPRLRRLIHHRIAHYGRKALTAIHPAASIGSDNRLGDGLLMAAGARITSNVTTGLHVHLNVNATVSHDGEIGDFVTISPGATVCGSVRIDDGVYIGAGATVIQGLHIGEGAVVGAGAVVVRDVPPGVLATGVPARWNPPSP